MSRSCERGIHRPRTSRIPHRAKYPAEHMRGSIDASRQVNCKSVHRYNGRLTFNLFNFLMNASLRAAVIAEWRGLPANKTRPDRWQAPGDLLPKLMQQLGLSERLRESEVIDAWKSIVGEFIAAHSCPVSLRAGVLFVRVLQPALHYQFEQISKAEILRKLKQRFGAKIIREIRFRSGSFLLRSDAIRQIFFRPHNFVATTANRRQLSLVKWRKWSVCRPRPAWRSVT